MDGQRLISLALFLSVILLFGCTGGPTVCPQCGANETTPTHSAAQVSQAMSRYLTEYYGLWSNQPETPVYLDGVWSSKVAIFTDSGGVMALDVYFFDGNLSVQKMTQRIVLLEEKKGINPIPGRASCSEGKLKVTEFGSSYCVDCINARAGLASFRKSFGEEIDYEYAVLHDYSDGIFAKYGDENVTLASKYYLCAQNLSRLEEFRNCAESKYATQVGVPLTKDELSSCTGAANITKDEVEACLPWASSRIALDEKIAETYFGRGAKPPYFVLDCRLEMRSPNLLRYAICYEYPQTKGC